MIDTMQWLLGISIVLFGIGLLGLIVRRNLLVMLMFMELMLNAVLLSLVVFSYQLEALSGIVLIFLLFIVATAEIALAIPILVLLVRKQRSLDPGVYADLKG